MLKTLLRTELKARFDGSVLGKLWPILAPLAQLFTFAFIFVHIFKARVPGLEGVGYIVWLALGMWPWFAVQESVGRAANVFVDGAALSSKVAIKRSLQVTSSCMISSITHMLGYVVVLLYFAVMGTKLHWSWVPLSVALWLPIYLLAYGASLLAACVQVFVKDMVHGLPLALTMWFFLTPIFYASEMIPEQWRSWLYLNPMTGYVEANRSMLLSNHLPMMPLIYALIGTAVVCLLGWFVYHRCEKQIEEFL